MSSELIETFNGLNVRIIDINGDPWYVVTDVCKILGIKNVSQALENISESSRSMFRIGQV